MDVPNFVMREMEIDDGSKVGIAVTTSPTDTPADGNPTPANTGQEQPESGSLYLTSKGLDDDDDDDDDDSIFAGLGLSNHFEAPSKGDALESTPVEMTKMPTEDNAIQTLQAAVSNEKRSKLIAISPVLHNQLEEDEDSRNEPDDENRDSNAIQEPADHPDDDPGEDPADDPDAFQEDIDNNEKNIGTDESREEDLSIRNTLTVTEIEDGECDDDAEEHSLIEVSVGKLFVVLVPLFCLAGVFWKLGLVNVSISIIVGCCRTFTQLSLLGTILVPIFKWGTKRPSLVLGYALFMVVLASYEASSRTKYSFQGQWYYIFGSLLLNVGWVGSLAFGVVLRPRPLWKPQYVLPIIGMLLGNSINGISISLDAITTALVEDQSEIELYLSFGASKYEAVSRIFSHAIQKGSTPVLNMLRTVGFVSLPGMMTGQILGGSSSTVAARYQMLILFLITLCTLSTIMLNSILAIETAFCPHQLLRPERFMKNQKLSVIGLVIWILGTAFGGRDSLFFESSNIVKLNAPAGTLHQGSMSTTPPLFPSPSSLEIEVLQESFSHEHARPLLEISGLSRYFMVNVHHGSTSNHIAENHLRVLFKDLSFNVNEGDVLLVSGPSGTGKTLLLRTLAGLSPAQEGRVKLEGRDWHNENLSAPEWRKMVRYVTQYKVQIPGTPSQFIRKVSSFECWKNEDQTDFAQGMVERTSDYIRQWGLTTDFLDKEWSTLSGGEAQRVMVALALASGAKILLFDEATSALDTPTKVAVEHSVMEYVDKLEGGVLWISHDEQQQKRMTFA